MEKAAQRHPAKMGQFAKGRSGQAQTSAGSKPGRAFGAGRRDKVHLPNIGRPQSPGLWRSCLWFTFRSVSKKGTMADGYIKILKKRPKVGPNCDGIVRNGAGAENKGGLSPVSLLFQKRPTGAQPL